MCSAAIQVDEPKSRLDPYSSDFVVPCSPNMSTDKEEEETPRETKAAQSLNQSTRSARIDEDGQGTMSTMPAMPIPAPAHVYYSPPGSPPPHMPVYMGGMMHYYHPAGSSPPGLGYPPHYPVHFVPHPMGMHAGSPPAYQQYYQSHPHTQDPRMHDISIQRTQSTGSVASLEGSSPTKRGEGRATARISRSSRTKSATELQDDLKFDSTVPVESLTRTTLMVRNLPNKYQAADVIELLKSVGLEGTYDFLYVPIDYKNATANLGYAFINMVDPKDSLRLFHAFAGKRWDEKGSKKVCEISYGRVQGFDALVNHFKEAKFPSREARFVPLVWEKRMTVLGKQVVDGEAKTIFDLVSE